MASLASSRTGRHLQFYVQGCRQVVGCIPYRCKNDEGDLEVLLISSQKGPALFFPKGGWECDEHIKDAVSREAEEEAGVVGIVQCLLGTWRFKSKSQDKIHDGYIFPLQVTKELDVWPEKNVRQRVWMSINEAREALAYSWMKEALHKFVNSMNHAQEREDNLTPFALQVLRSEEQRMAQNRDQRLHLHKQEEENRTTSAFDFCRTEEPRIGLLVDGNNTSVVG